MFTRLASRRLPFGRTRVRCERVAGWDESHRPDLRTAEGPVQVPRPRPCATRQRISSGADTPRMPSPDASTVMTVQTRASLA